MSIEESIKISKNRKKTIEVSVLNRRKRKLDEMLERGDEYFSEESIRERDPIMYGMYIGSKECTSKFSTFLFSQMDREMCKGRLDEEEEINFYVRDVYSNSREEDELIRLMSIRFLMGEDEKYFNYGEVDNNEQYDDLETADRDAEEAYFEAEEPKQSGNTNEYTGIQDY